MKKLHTVNETGLHFKEDGKGGMYPAPLPSGVVIPEGIQASYDQETSVLSWSIPPETEGGEPTEHTYTLTQQDIDAAVASLAPDLATLKEAKLKEIAAARFEFEVGGITVGGLPIPTNRDTQSKLTSAYVQATADPLLTLRWKVSLGNWITLDAPTIIAVGDAVFAHVQSAFDQEEQLTQDVEDATNEAELSVIS